MARKPRRRSIVIAVVVVLVLSGAGVAAVATGLTGCVYRAVHDLASADGQPPAPPSTPPSQAASGSRSRTRLGCASDTSTSYREP